MLKATETDVQADRILRFIILDRGLLVKISRSVFTVTANCVFERLNLHMFVFNFSAQI